MKIESHYFEKMNKDDDYEPKNSSSSSSDDEILIPRRNSERKNLRKLPLKSRQANKKPKRSPLKTRNHDDFFVNLDESGASNTEDSLEETTNVADTLNQSVKQSNTNVDVQNNTTECNADIDDDSLHAMLNRKLETISNQLNLYSQDIGELKNEMLIIKRLVAKVEVLIKSRKETTSSDSDTDFLGTLQSFGLPITTKENLDNLEQKLKSEDEKSKLVCLIILFLQNQYHLHA